MTHSLLQNHQGACALVKLNSSSGSERAKRLVRLQLLRLLGVPTPNCLQVIAVVRPSCACEDADILPDFAIAST